MNTPWYPLRFEPIFKPALWGGRRLGELLGRELSAGAAVGEAWVLSDQGSDLSTVADGPLAGQTLRQLLGRDPVGLLGRPAERFPLLLKFIDAREALSVQVHPHDRHRQLLAAGECGKTEAWVVLQSDPGSCIYAGLRPGIGPAQLQDALAAGTVADCLHSFEPRPGDTVFLPAGTVHAIGAGVLLFEVQQNSDVTYRLFDWGRVDARSGQPRQLHVRQALACVDYSAGPARPVAEDRNRDTEPLVACDYFSLQRLRGDQPRTVGAAGRCRILVGLDGRGQVEHRGHFYPVGPGDVLLLPAAVGSCRFEPVGPATLLDCGPVF